MNASGWKELIIKVVRDYDTGDYEQIDLLSKLLEENDAAKQALRDAGFGYTGLGVLETVCQAIKSVNDLPA